MKVLLDENLDHRLRSHLHPHQVFTVSHMGWSGLRNGMLLQAAEDTGFDIFLLTGDQTLSYEQNLTGRTLATIALSSIEWRILRNHLPQIAAAIDRLARNLPSVDCGRFDRRNAGKASNEGDIDK